MSTHRCGGLVWHTNHLDRRQKVEGHAHRRDHVTFCTGGWLMLLVKDGPDADRVVQLAHHLYHPPPGAPIPVRFSDWPGFEGPELHIRFFEPDEPIPLDGEVIRFEPAADHMLIPAGVRHSIHTLSLQPTATYRCVFTAVEGEDQLGPYV